MSDADVIASDILKGKKAYKEDENGKVIKIQGTIETVEPINDEENKSINIDKGYLSSSLSYPDYEYVTST
jgi:hypothetical protein